MRTAWRLANPVVAGIVALGAYAQEPPPHTVETAKQQRLALVLSGGGARGAAHIGALKVLEELHIVPDLLVGTSMGSIVGGLYAAGWSPAEIEKLLNDVDWNLVFSDTVDRYDKPFRRKLDDERIFVQGRLHFQNGKPFVPPGLLGGQRLELLLDTIEMVSSAPVDFDQMPVPFRAVAVDIGTGEAVVIGSGRLSRAMRASMAIPGMFPAVERDGHTLSDGGAVANLPVRVARDLGATAVIAVDITSPLVKEGESYQDFFSVFNRMNSMLTFFNRVEDVKTIGLDDVYIRPELGDISFLAFDRATEAVGIGEAVAREKIDALKRFASTDEQWHAYMARRTPRDRSAVSVDVIDIENTSGLDDRVVRANLKLEPARSVGLNTIREGVMSLKALEAFGTVLTRLEPGPGGNRLVLNTPPQAYGRDSLQIGVSLQDDLQGYTNYSVFFRHLVQPVNRLGGEIVSTFELGEPFQVSSELYQPLEATQHWFVSPGAEVRRDLFTLWAKGKPFGDFQIKSWKGRLDIGRVLGNWGDVAVQVYRGNVEGAPDSGLALAFNPFDLSTGGVLMRFRVDTRDRTVFPRVGAQARAIYDHGSESLGAEESYRRWILTASNAFSWGENTVNPYVELGDNLEDTFNLTNAFFLGGLGRISGYGQKELFGERVAFGRVTYYRRLARLDIASLRLRAYVGASLEYGNTFGTDQPLQAKSMIMAGGPFVAADTPIGPLYFGWGIAEGDRSSFYVLIGEPL